MTYSLKIIFGDLHSCLLVYNFLKICHIDLIFTWGLRGFIWGLSLLEIAEKEREVATIQERQTA